jgi:hypothetical protein
MAARERAEAERERAGRHGRGLLDVGRRGHAGDCGLHGRDCLAELPRGRIGGEARIALGRGPRVTIRLDEHVDRRRNRRDREDGDERREMERQAPAAARRGSPRIKPFRTRGDVGADSQPRPILFATLGTASGAVNTRKGCSGSA